MLQQIERFDLAPDAQPEGSLPPPRWKDGKGRQAIERIWPASSVTAFVKVRSLIYCMPFFLMLIDYFQGGLWVRAIPARKD